MLIEISDAKVARALVSEKACRKAYGANLAKKIILRIDTLAAAENLAAFWPPLSGPERCHALTTDLAGHFSMNLTGKMRLIFKPYEPRLIDTTADERERWKSIDHVNIVSIGDTHG